MSEYVIPTTYTFNVNGLLKAVEDVYRICGKTDQVNLRAHTHHTGNAFSFGAGSLYRDVKPYAKEEDFTAYIPQLGNNYLIDVCEAIVPIALQYGVALGRARLLNMKPKSTLTYHMDTGAAYRFHVPIITNANVFFVTNDLVDRMSDVGRLYVYRTDVHHTVVNASRQDRLHLVCSGSKVK